MTKEFLRSNNIEFEAKDIIADASAMSELQALGALSTPVTVIGEEVVIGFNEARLRELLGIE